MTRNPKRRIRGIVAVGAVLGVLAGGIGAASPAMAAWVIVASYPHTNAGHSACMAAVAIDTIKYHDHFQCVDGGSYYHVLREV